MVLAASLIAVEPEYSLQEIVDNARLPSSLSVVARISAVVESPNSTVDDVAAILETDISLSAKVLRIANSPLFMGGGIDTVKTALIYVGLGDIVALVSASEVMAAFEDIPLHDNPYKFWYENLFAASAAQVIARHICLPEGRMFTAGLLRGVGELAIRAALPNEANAALNRQLHTGEHLHEIEQNILGFSHAELSGKLLHSWQLPAPLVQPIKNYINPHLAGEYRVEAAVIYIANYMKNERFDVPQPPLKDNLLHPLAVQDLELIHKLLPEAIRLSGDAGKLITG